MIAHIVPQELFDQVKTFFGGDAAKTWLWFQSPNPMLDMKTPLHMIRIKRIDRLKHIIDKQLIGIHA